MTHLYLLLLTVRTLRMTKRFVMVSPRQGGRVEEKTEERNEAKQRRREGGREGGREEGRNTHPQRPASGRCHS